MVRSACFRARAEQAVRSAGGLCTDSFSANVLTAGLDYAALRVGTRLFIGRCSVEIVRVGKPCYAECSLVRSRAVCPLPKSCAFAKVVAGGDVHTNDPIGIETK